MTTESTIGFGRGPRCRLGVAMPDRTSSDTPRESPGPDVREQEGIHHEIDGLGVEGTLQRIERSEFRFSSLGSAVTIDF